MYIHICMYRGSCVYIYIYLYIYVCVCVCMYSFTQIKSTLYLPNTYKYL